VRYIVFCGMGKQNRQMGSGYFKRVSCERCVLASSYLPVCMFVCLCLCMCVCMYQHSSHWIHFPEIWYVCWETANSVKTGKKNYRSHEYPSVFHVVDFDVCCASLAPISEFITLLRMTYLRQQYQGNSLSLCRGNSGYANAPQCYVTYL